MCLKGSDQDDVNEKNIETSINAEMRNENMPDKSTDNDGKACQHENTRFDNTETTAGLKNEIKVCVAYILLLR